MYVWCVEIFVYVVVCVNLVEIVYYIVVDYVDDGLGYCFVDFFEGVYVFLYDYFGDFKVFFDYVYFVVFFLVEVFDFGRIMYGYYIYVIGVGVGFDYYVGGFSYVVFFVFFGSFFEYCFYGVSQFFFVGMFMEVQFVVFGEVWVDYLWVDVDQFGEFFGYFVVGGKVVGFVML